MNSSRYPFSLKESPFNRPNIGLMNRPNMASVERMICGNRDYELTNHLGNVMATISDRKEGKQLPTPYDPDYYEAVVRSAADYYPFGMEMPDRTYSSTNNVSYRFNGKENDRGIFGEGPLQDYGMRMYNPALGRFLSVDPLAKDYPFYTPYQFAGNKPIWATDLDGAEEKLATGVIAWPSANAPTHYTYPLGNGETATKMVNSDSWYYQTMDCKGFSSTYEWHKGADTWSLVRSEKADYDARNSTVKQLTDGMAVGTFAIPGLLMGAGAGHAAGLFETEAVTANFGANAKEFAWDIFKEKTIKGDWSKVEWGDAALNFLPFVNQYTKSIVKNTTGEFLNTSYSELKKEGLFHDITSDPIIGLKIGKDAALDSTFDLLKELAPNKGSQSLFEGLKRLIDYGLDSGIQEHDDNLEKSKNGGK